MAVPVVPKLLLGALALKVFVTVGCATPFWVAVVTDEPPERVLKKKPQPNSAPKAKCLVKK